MKKRLLIGGGLVLAVALAVTIPRCRRTAPDANNSNTAQPGGLRPFSSKEPLQYKATRVTTAPGTPPVQVGIARDGDRSRLDYTEARHAVTLLDLPNGRVLISADRRMFARLRAEEPAAPEPSPDESAFAPDVSPERLNAQLAPQAEFRRLRAELFADRMATVYQIVFSHEADHTEALLWLDDETQFPLKTETYAVVGGVRQAPEVMEIRDLTLGPPPPGWFDLPAGYAEVPAAEFWRAVLSAQ
jgi:hypothetical protein